MAKSAKEKTMAKMASAVSEAPMTMKPPSPIERAKKEHRMSIRIEFEDKIVDGKSVTAAKVNTDNYEMNRPKSEEYTNENTLLACVKEHWNTFNKAVGSGKKVDTRDDATEGE